MHEGVIGSCDHQMGAFQLGEGEGEGGGAGRGRGSGVLLMGIFIDHKT